MNRWNVMHVFRDDQGLTFIEVDHFDNEASARAHANSRPTKGGQTWIEEHRPKARPVYHDRPAKPIGLDELRQLRSQLAAFRHKTALLEEEEA